MNLGRAHIALAAMAMMMTAPSGRCEGVAFPATPEPSRQLPIKTRTRGTEVEKALAAQIFDLTRNRPEDYKALIKEVLCTYISNPDSVSIALDLGSPIRRLSGRIKRIEVSMTNTVIKKLRVDHAYIVLKDVALDLPKLVRDKKFRFREKGTTDFAFEVSEDSLNQLLKEKAGKLKVRGAHLSLRNGHMTFTGKLRVLLFNNHVKLNGRLFARNGTQVHFAPRGVKLDFLPVPRFLLGILRDKMNPLADLKNFRFNVDIGTIETTENRILLASPGLADHVRTAAQRERRGQGLALSWPPADHSTLLASGDAAPLR